MHIRRTACHHCRSNLSLCAFTRRGVTERIPLFCTTPARHCHHSASMASQEAFDNCKELAMVTLGNSLTAIKGVRPAHPLPVMYPAATLDAVATCLMGRPCQSSGLPVGVPLTCRWPVPCTQSAFRASGLTEIVVPDSVVEIGAVCTTPARHCNHHTIICLRGLARQRRPPTPACVWCHSTHSTIVKI